MKSSGQFVSLSDFGSFVEDLFGDVRAHKKCEHQFMPKYDLESRKMAMTCNHCGFVVKPKENTALVNPGNRTGFLPSTI